MHQQAIAHRDAKRIRDEQRNASLGVCDEARVRIDDAHRVVLVLVDERAVGGTGDIDFDLLGNGQKPEADDLGFDRVDLSLDRVRLYVHARGPSLARCNRISPSAPIAKLSFGPTTVEEPNSSMIAGPAASKPRGNVVR